jgi:hypothetical protein
MTAFGTDLYDLDDNQLTALLLIEIPWETPSGRLLVCTATNPVLLRRLDQQTLLTYARLAGFDVRNIVNKTDIVDIVIHFNQKRLQKQADRLELIQLRRQVHELQQQLHLANSSSLPGSTGEASPPPVLQSQLPQQSVPHRDRQHSLSVDMNSVTDSIAPIAMFADNRSRSSSYGSDRQIHTDTDSDDFSDDYCDSFVQDYNDIAESDRFSDVSSVGYSLSGYSDYD